MISTASANHQHHHNNNNNHHNPHGINKANNSNYSNSRAGPGSNPNMGVAWFHQATPALVQSPSFRLSRFKSDQENNNHNNLNPTSIGLKKTSASKRSPEADVVDVIDIEDEDHSFAAFFIGMKSGPSASVKRPLVFSQLFLFTIGKIPPGKRTTC